MKNFFRNLSVKTKSWLGFLIVGIIFLNIALIQDTFIKKIFKYRKSVMIEQQIASDFNKLIYLITNDIANVNKIYFAEKESDIKQISEKHSKISEEIEKTILHLQSIDLTGYSNEKLILLINNALINDIEIYRKDIKNSIDQIFAIQRVIINPEQIQETDISTSLQLNNDTTTDSSKIVYTSEKTIKETVKIYKDELKKHINFIDKQAKTLFDRFETIKEMADKSKEKNSKEIDKLNRISIETSAFILLFGLIVSWIIASVFSRLIVNPISQLQKVVQKLSKGELPDYKPIETNDEIGWISRSIHSLIKGLKNTAKFALDIGQNKFDTEYTPLSDKDVLGNSLLGMRESLQQAKEEEEKRKLEDIRRNWTTEGLAKFAEILRHHTENIRELSNDIIVNLVKYLNANQGGLFILNDSDEENPYLELLAAYAYNRKKYIEKKIPLGEGLVGAVAIEKFSIYMTDVPEEYIEIESGIGSANPTSILIVPLKIEEQALGVIELASLSEFQKHEIELVEKIAESIAATLSTSRINTRTAELLEQSKQQAREMQEQEEEMRQTIEQLQAAYEDIAKQKEELEKELKEVSAINQTLQQQERINQLEINKLKEDNKEKDKQIEILQNSRTDMLDAAINGVIILSKTGNIEFVNRSALDSLGYRRSELLGRSVKKIMPRFADPEIKNLVAELNSMVNTLRENRGGKEILLASNDEKREVMINAHYMTLGDDITYTLFFRDTSDLDRIIEEKDKFIQNVQAKEFEAKIKYDRIERLCKKHNIPIKLEDNILLNFDDGFSIGLDIIDKQHKTWIDYINNLYKGLRQGIASQKLEEFFVDLIKYTEYHFSFEEKYLKDFNCEGFDEHKEIHTGFVSTLLEHYQDYKNGDTETAYKLIIMLYTWVKDHILIRDKSYVDCFKRNGLK